MEQISRAEQLEQKRIFWKQHIESWQETGLSQAEYCRRHNLKHHQLVYWKKRYSKIETGVSFVPFDLDNLTDMPAQANRTPLCVVINDHYKIEVRAGFDPRVLRQLLFALQA